MKNETKKAKKINEKMKKRNETTQNTKLKFLSDCTKNQHVLKKLQTLDRKRPVREILVV